MFASELKEFFRVFLNEIKAIKTKDDVKALPKFKIYHDLYEELVRRRLPTKVASSVIARIKVDVTTQGIEELGEKMYTEVINEFARMLSLIYETVIEEFDDQEAFLKFAEDMSLTIKA